MNTKDYEKLYDDLIATARKITKEKGAVYTLSNDDKLINFKRIAELTNTTPAQVAVVYLWKHLEAIRNQALNPKSYDPESLDERVPDCFNYLVLLTAIIKEEAAKKAAEQAARPPQYIEFPSLSGGDLKATAKFKAEQRRRDRAINAKD